MIRERVMGGGIQRFRDRMAKALKKQRNKRIWLAVADKSTGTGVYVHYALPRNRAEESYKKRLSQ